MNILLLITSLFLCDELTEARQRYEDSIRKIEASVNLEDKIEQQEKTTPVVPSEPESQSHRVSVEWMMHRSTAAADAVILVSGPNCSACVQREQQFKSNGTPFRKLTVDEAISEGLPLRRLSNGLYPIPQVFPDTSAVSSQSSPVVEVGAAPGLMVIPLLSEHLSAQSPQSDGAMKSWFDIDVTVPDYVPSLIQGLVLNQRWESPDYGLVLDWSGRKTIQVNPGQIIFQPPVTVRKSAGIINVQSSLESMTFSQDGRQITLGLNGAPDLTIVLKGTQYSAVPVSAQVTAVKKVRNISDQPQNYTESDRQADINHLLTGPAHQGKFTREYLETLSGYELIDLHNSEHGVPTIKGVKVRR